MTPTPSSQDISLPAAALLAVDLQASRQATLTDPRYARMMAEDGHEHPEAYLDSCDQLFRGVELRGKDVLEIGSGRGLLSIYLAMRGARVTSLEPEMAGSQSGMMHLQQTRCAALGLKVETLPVDFNGWRPTRTFDVIVSRSTVNHLYPSEHHALAHQPTWDGYVQMFQHTRSLLRPGGVFVARDSSRYALFLLLRKWIRKPWKTGHTGVDWRHHQNAATWVRLMWAAGFTSASRDYLIPYPLRRVSWLVNTGLVSFFLKGVFIVKARA